jgi:hypothetical protein
MECIHAYVPTKIIHPPTDRMYALVFICTSTMTTKLPVSSLWPRLLRLRAPHRRCCLREGHRGCYCCCGGHLRHHCCFYGSHLRNRVAALTHGTFGDLFSFTEGTRGAMSVFTEGTFGDVTALKECAFGALYFFTDANFRDVAPLNVASLTEGAYGNMAPFTVGCGSFHCLWLLSLLLLLHRVS